VNININIKPISLRKIKLWKLLSFILVLSLLLQGLVYTNNRTQPLIVNYDLISTDANGVGNTPASSKIIKSYDDKFSDSLLTKCPISERSFKSVIDDVFQYGCRDPLVESKKPRANAAFVVLARNSEIDGVILSMRSLERRFNQWFNYPWIFINDEPFTEEFETRVYEVASGDVKFGVIPQNKWKFDQQQSQSPSDQLYFNEAVESQGDRGIMYGNMPSYHNMCRFYSGYFFEHPLVVELDWYWRVEPEVDFYCDLTYDPFIEMEKRGKKYGYTIAIKELVDTVPNLFRYTEKFIKEQNIELPDTWKFFTNNFKFYTGTNENLYFDVKNVNDLWNKLHKNTLYYYAKLNAPTTNDPKILKLLVKHSKMQGLNSPVQEKYNNRNYNMCHFWSNFEIASNKLFTSPQYKAYYEFLEESNGFFTERWGDAPVHSLAAGMFLSLDEIHYFRDIGYKHSTIGHCPYNAPHQLPYKAGPKFKHQVLPEDEIYYADYDPPAIGKGSHLREEDLGASGCRCRCPSDHREIENSGGSCSSLWLKLTSDDYNAGRHNENFVGGLGDFNKLDLDEIEMQALQSLQEWVKKGKKIENWSITDEDKEKWIITYTK
jgi:mannosyltransferase